MTLPAKRYFMAAPILALFCLGTNAQTPAGAYVPVRMDLYTATSDLWRVDAGFQSAIRLKNMLATTEMGVSVTLYMEDGTPYPLPPVMLAKSRS